MKDLIPARARRVVYLVYAWLGVAAGAFQAGIGALPDTQTPDAFKVALAVYAFLGTALGFMASANTNTEEQE